LRRGGSGRECRRLPLSGFGPAPGTGGLTGTAVRLWLVARHDFAAVTRRNVLAPGPALEAHGMRTTSVFRSTLAEQAERLRVQFFDRHPEQEAWLTEKRPWLDPKLELIGNPSRSPRSRASRPKRKQKATHNSM
jgi:hypothetical protein